MATILRLTQRDNPAAAAGSSRTAAPIAKPLAVARPRRGCDGGTGGFSMIAVPVTLATAAGAVGVNTWLGARISLLRRDLKVSVGDGGHEPLLRRMRAQANFVENVPLFLILLGGLEISGANPWVLGALALVMLAGRIAHGYGMDGGPLQRWRRDGMISSTVALFLIALWALFCAGEALLGR